MYCESVSVDVLRSFYFPSDVELYSVIFVGSECSSYSKKNGSESLQSKECQGRRLSFEKWIHNCRFWNCFYVAIVLEHTICSVANTICNAGRYLIIKGRDELEWKARYARKKEILHSISGSYSSVPLIVEDEEVQVSANFLLQNWVRKKINSDMLR